MQGCYGENKKEIRKRRGMRGLLVTTGRASNWQDFPMNQGKNHIPDDGGSVLGGVYTVAGDKHPCFKCIKVYPQY